MNRVSILLFVVLVSLLGSVYSQTEQCLRVRPQNEGYLVSSPATADPALTSCTRYAAKSCCTSKYTDSVAAKTDPYSTNLLATLANVPDTCASLIQELSCLYCSPYQQFLTALPISNPYDKLYICENFCNKLLTDCGSAQIIATNNTISETYLSGKELCLSDAFWEISFIDVVSVGSKTVCFDPLSAERPCTDTDYIASYTICDKSKNTRSLVYSWKSDSTCKGGVALPRAINNLPCDIQCSAGNYLPLGGTKCSPCYPGTFSLGGGLRIETWTEWPSDPDVSLKAEKCVSTSSRPPANFSCNTWTLHDQFISSGNNSAFNNIISPLTASFTLIRNGSISFEVKVDAEKKFDMLVFTLDTQAPVEIHTKESKQFFSYNLTAGPHVVRWEYKKDPTLSMGEDAALIYSLEVNGLRYADDYCLPCGPGKYANENGTVRCKECPMNFVPSGSPKTSCSECSSDSYALPGEPSCSLRLPCTKEDYVMDYSKCREPGVRDKIYKWEEPVICNPALSGSVNLTESQYNIPCASCPGGQFRNSQYQCQVCSDGKASSGGDSNSCTTCPIGTAAIKANIYDNDFPLTFPPGWSTRCERCESEGFRLNSEYIDSGSSVGGYESFLFINKTFYVSYPGSSFYRFVFIADCPTDVYCGITIWLDGDFNSGYYPNQRGFLSQTINDGGFDAGDGKRGFNVTVPIVESGRHNLSIDFFVYGMFPFGTQRRTAVLFIPYIAIYGVDDGGAPECVPCQGGYASSKEGSLQCQQCAAGSYAEFNDSGVAACKPCEVDTAALTAGESSCWECPDGTSTLGKTGATDCVNPQCVYTYYFDEADPSNNVTFDLHLLTRSDTMWGPVLDPISRQQYFINVCSRDHQNGTCKNADDTVMDTYACQVTPQGASNDLGRLMGFFYDPSRVGVDIILTHGTVCGAVNASFERHTTLRMICSPDDEMGFPSAPQGSPIEEQTCVYFLEWHTKYACPICSPRDYDWMYTPCESAKDGSSFRYKRFYWKDNPKRCLNGVDLPADEQVPCVDIPVLDCQSGRFFSEKTGNCSECPVGTFAVASGEFIQYWSVDKNGTLPPGFMKYCEERTSGKTVPCSTDGGWESDDVFIEARGNLPASEVAVLYAKRNFIRDGYMVFIFHVVTEFNEPFDFYMDDILVKSWNRTTIHEDGEIVTVPIGTHTFKWKFSPFISNQRQRSVVVVSVRFSGTVAGVTSCSPCPGDLVATRTGSASCMSCPTNQIFNSSSACSVCPANTFSLSGDRVCHALLPCKAADYYPVYTNCSGGKRNKTYEVLSIGVSGVNDIRVMCDDTPLTRPKPEFGIPCAPCPTGYYKDGDNCKHCDVGQHYDADARACQTALPGTATVRYKEFFSDTQGSIYYSWPNDNWYSGCKGECGTNGWRPQGTSVDSGVHYEAADSWLSFSDTFETDGYISFVTNIESHFSKKRDDDNVQNYVAFEFFIDGEANFVPIQGTHEARFPVTKGDHDFLFVHRQNRINPDGYIRTIVSNIHMQGTIDGGTTDYVCSEGYYSDGGLAHCTACPSGTYGDVPNLGKCKACPANQFSFSTGNTHCADCGLHTIATNDSTDCKNDCAFSEEVPNKEKVVEEYRWRFADISRHYIVARDDTLNVKITFSLCSRMNPLSSPCSNTNTFACLEDPSRKKYDAGRIVSYKAHNLNGFYANFSYGTHDGCVGNAKRQTVVLMDCDLNAAPYGEPKLVLPKNLNSTNAASVAAYLANCSYFVVLPSLYACPVCKDTDYTLRYSECQSGKRLIEYIPKIQCTDAKSPHEITCESVSVNYFFLLFVLAVVIAVVLCLVGVAYFMYRKKNEIYRKYESLNLKDEGPDSLELQPVETVSEEEEEKKTTKS